MLFYPVRLYQQGFRYFHMGYASAMAMVLFVVAFAVTTVIIVNSRAGCTTRGRCADGDEQRQSPAQRVRARPRRPARDGPATPGS